MYNIRALEPSDIQETFLNREVFRVTLRGVRDKPGVAAELFSRLAEEGIAFMQISYEASAGGRGDLGFAVLNSQKEDILRITDELVEDTGGDFCSIHEDVAMFSIVISPRANSSLVVSEVFQLLAENGVNMDMISFARGVLSIMVKIYRLDNMLLALEDMGIVPEIGV